MPTVITGRTIRTKGDCGGKPCIAGHRIRVMDIAVPHEHLRMSADEIPAQYPSLSLSDVHAALACYYDKIAEIRADIRHNTGVAEQIRSRFQPKLREKLSVK